MSAIFVTATGTDIGKTFVTAALIRHCRENGEAVDALKPVLTGFDPAEATASDPGRLLAALGRSSSLQEIERISPWRFEAPLSPNMAAAREGRELDFEAVVRFCRDTAAASGGMLFVEGIGGLMVPLDNERTVLDWIAALGWPVLLVTGSYLGTISHTLTAIEATRTRGLQIAAVAVSESEASTVDLGDTVDTIRRFSALDVAALPRDADRHPDAIRRIMDCMIAAASG
jgi:dethiobiotin synthetase